MRKLEDFIRFFVKQVQGCKQWSALKDVFDIYQNEMKYHMKQVKRKSMTDATVWWMELRDCDRLRLIEEEYKKWGKDKTQNGIEKNM